MGIFDGSFNHRVVSGTIPAGSGVAKAIDKLHSRTLFLECCPYLVSSSPAPAPAWEAYEVPRGLKPLTRRVDVFNVKNKYENPIMGSDINSAYEFIDLADGIWLRTRSPMGTVLDATFGVRERREGGLELVYEVECRCNRALASMTKKELEKSCEVLVDNIAKRLGQN